MSISRSSALFKWVIVTTVAFASVGGIAHATDQDEDSTLLRVFMNHARVLKLDRPVSKVIIGNSNVADATVADAKTIVLTGRSFGTTNIVLLDSAGNAIVDERILVSIDEGNTVRVFKQTARTVLSCTPNCEEHADTSSLASSSTSSSVTTGSSSSASTMPQ
jgi:Flp pilus assembly secretin CpaC